MLIDTWPVLVKMEADEYHADPCPRPSLSASCATTLVTRSPLHAHLVHPRLGGREKATTPAMDRGTAFHTTLLGTGKQAVLIEADSFRTKAAREARNSVIAAGNIPMLAEDIESLYAMVAAVREQFGVLGIHLGGQSEMAAFWEVESACGPVLCRGMMDHVALDDGVIIDLKTIRNAHPHMCQRHMIEYGCDIQWAAYTSALRALRPDLAGREDFIFIFVEAESPYCVTAIRPDGSMRELGAMRWRRAVETWAQCLAENSWPGYATQPIWIDAPTWAIKSEEGIYA